MKALFTRKAGVAICLLMMTGLPWSCVDHAEPLKSVTCSCPVLDNSGIIGYDTKTMDCPGGKAKCECGGLADRGRIKVFECN
ncbi:hypothetical protein LZD49_21335 [Dyadobacter sp. CY261]|uniref:hypothetical protein n=1 Tax=Dyadobacter sp. CY261 TaxID=2907203 RepID=UPI001F1A5867|nr:hypothetical protein [Dyadobacter sp. CY261]MCF0073038.1 hypothetical protein [Dyadobacter sp. CY261]